MRICYNHIAEMSALKICKEYSWLFNYEEKIKIVSPAKAVEEFRGMLRKFDEI